MTAPQYAFGSVVGWTEELDRPEDEQSRYMVLDCGADDEGDDTATILCLALAADLVPTWTVGEIAPTLTEFLYLVEGS